MPLQPEPLDSNTSDNLSSHCRQGQLALDSESTQHVFTLTCHERPKQNCVRDSSILTKESAVGVGSNQYKTKFIQMVDLKLLEINKKENDFKSLLFEDLYRKIAADHLNDPQQLSEKLQLPIKETLAIYKGDLQKLSTYRLLHALTRFGYDVCVCTRPHKDYSPGAVYFE